MDDDTALMEIGPIKQFRRLRLRHNGTGGSVMIRVWVESN